MNIDHTIRYVYVWFVRTFFYFFPDVPIMMKLRGWFYSFALKKCGRNFQITNNVMINNPEKVSIGDNVYISYNSLILANGNVEIGNDVLVGPNVVIVGDNHSNDGGSYRFGKLLPGDITVGNCVWIGANCTIVPNSMIPDGSVLGANSILNKKFDTCGLYAGSPAKLIKKK
jgi:acetyltransferase-like isoleucine patch superfamily enzyme